MMANTVPWPSLGLPWSTHLHRSQMNHPRELKNALQQEWYDISQNTIRKVIGSMIRGMAYVAAHVAAVDCSLWPYMFFMCR